MKREFRVLLSVSPEFDQATQIKLVPALAAIHNFRRLNDDDNDQSNNSDEGTESDDEDDCFGDPIFFPVPEAFHQNDDPMELTADDLSAGITRAETTRANARRDAIAERMWASYQAYLAQNE